MSHYKDFNFGWKFNLADDRASSELGYNDSTWREVNLPHDWSVEASFDEKFEGATGYLPGGIGWYRKHFDIDTSKGDLSYVLFDGIYNNAEVWLNGKKLGNHPYGYSPFYFDLTPHLTEDDKGNVLSVRVDHSRYADSRWYTGSGIYRNVKLVTIPRLNIPIWGTFVTTPEVSAERATLELQTTVSNAHASEQNFTLRHRVLDAAGSEVAQSAEILSSPANASLVNQQKASICTPNRWSVDAPHLYTVVSELAIEGVVIQSHQTTIGIRSIRFDVNEGFFLNGESMKIKGVCLHHDGGLVGAAVPDGVWRRRLQSLKDGGCNAIRMAHNPSSDALLDLCDELGFLVQDEFFDEWDYPKDKRLNQNQTKEDYVTNGYTEHFQEWAKRDLETTMLRGLNHPSIIQWSIGNEIEWTYPSQSEATGYFNPSWEGNYFWSLPPYSPEEIKERMFSKPQEDHPIGETAKKLGEWTRAIDTTRPVVANCILPSASMVSGYADALDIVGFSYGQVHYTPTHEHFPHKVIMGTENLGQWHEWKHVIDRPFISGMFIWTGVDYLGETNEQWPKKSLGCGLLDLAGFEKPSFRMMQSLWLEEPQVHLVTQRLEDSNWRLNDSGQPVDKTEAAWKTRTWFWHDVNEHWNYEAGDMIVVEVYSNCETVELFVNEKSQGVVHLADCEDHIFKWAVPYESGKISAQGFTSTSKPVETILHTSTELAHISLSADQVDISADCYDVIHITAEIVDSNNHPIRNTPHDLEFQIDGPCKLLGVDNGSITSTQNYQTNTVTTHNGRALLILQSTHDCGSISVSARSGAFRSEILKLSVQPI
ncbi:MAG: sugar-binding domain-containing protein [Opitutaceae bacterium]